MTRPETILIADDSEINRAVLRNLFEAQYNLLEAENGEQALMLLRQYSESITVVLLDLVMPEKDEKAILSMRNIPGVKTALVNTLNVYDILNCDKFIVVKDAVTKIEEVYK